MHAHTKFEIPASNNIKICSGHDNSNKYVRSQAHRNPKMVLNTQSSEDASTHQILNSYLTEYRRYAPDTKWDGLTDGQFLWGHKIIFRQKNKTFLENYNRTPLDMYNGLFQVYCKNPLVYTKIILICIMRPFIWVFTVCKSLGVSHI